MNQEVIKTISRSKVVSETVKVVQIVVTVVVVMVVVKIMDNGIPKGKTRKKKAST